MWHPSRHTAHNPPAVVGRLVHHISTDILRATIVLGIEGLVFAVALSRGLFRRLPVFSWYLFAVFASDALRFAIWFTLGFGSSTEFVVYWASQLLLMSMRAGVMYELCRRLLGRYRGVWALSRIVLVATAAALLLIALAANISSGTRLSNMFLTIERGFELAVLGVLVTAMAFCRYYRIPVARPVGLVGLGFSLYSAIAVISNTFTGHWFLAFVPFWREIHGDSFLLAELTWLIAVWRPLPADQPAPNLLDFQQYSDMTLTVNESLRELNARLEKILK